MLKKSKRGTNVDNSYGYAIHKCKKAQNSVRYMYVCTYTH